MLQLKDSILIYDLFSGQQFDNMVYTYQSKIKMLKTHGQVLIRDYDTNDLGSNQNTDL